jgi:uncharacterized protein YjbI with pentapeptide repeats
MANAEHVAILKKGVSEWNRWRETTNHHKVDLSDADLAGMKLNHVSFLHANLTGAILTRTQLEHAHLTNADLTRAVLTRANLEHVNARNAIFDGVVANEANFEVSTLRGARFRNAMLSGARFHRAYLRDADLTGAALRGSWLRFATLDCACCSNTDFTGANLCNVSMVKTDLRGADLTDAYVFGISAWNVETDINTRQDLIVGVSQANTKAPLRAHDLHTAQLLSLMLDGDGVRRVFNSVSSKLVLILGSFSPGEKPVLDALRSGLQRRGYVAVTFDFQRPSERDYAETIVVLAGMSRFVIADFTNAKEVRAEVAQVRSQYKRVPIIPLAKEGASLPVTMANAFSAEELHLIVRYKSIDDLLQKLQPSIIEPAEARASRIAESIARAEAFLTGAS